MIRRADNPSHEAAAAQLGDLARTLDGLVDPATDAMSRAQFLHALDASPRPVAGRRWLYAASGGGLLLAAAAAVVLIVPRGPEPLEYRVYGAAPEAGWLDVMSEENPGLVRFSEGTEIELAPGSQTKIAEVTKRGAHVVLRSGRLRARVVHRTQTKWMVGAGPYAIDVTGTAFDVTWSDRGGELEVRLLEGSVIVRGPSLHEGIRVSAGQRLVAHSATGNAELSTLDNPLARASNAPTPTAAPSHPVRRESPHITPSWTDLLTDGNFRAVIAQAQSRGIESTLRRGSLADLVALSDAARYSGDRGLARRGLLAQRRRFSSKPEAHAAAFLLGRMADDQGSPDEAMHWYELYLRESPRGVFAAEALGRKLVVLVRSGEEAEARTLARQYLQRFADGAHAAYAREVLSRP